MQSANWMRMGILSVALLAVVGVLAVLACGPSAASAPVQQSSAAGDVSESASVSATEAPFVGQQPGDGGTGGQASEPTGGQSGQPQDSGDESPETPMPTATRYIPPTSDRSLCKDEYTWPHVRPDGSYAEPILLGTRCPPDGHPALAQELRNYYNSAVREIEALEAQGETGEFPELRISVKANTAEAVDAVVELLEANGARWVGANRKPNGGVVATVRIGVLPELAEIDGVRHVGTPPEDRGPHLVVEETLPVESGLRQKYGAAVDRNRGRTARGEAGVYPVIRVSIIPWWEDDVDAVVEFLKANGGENITWTKDDDDPVVPGVIVADVSLEFVWDLAHFYGVRRVEEVKSVSKAKPSTPGGSGGSGVRVVPTPLPAPVPVAVAMQADQWHRAGFTGAGVEVAVIDGDFRGFSTRILPLLSHPVHFLCYAADGDPSEGTLSASSLAAGGNTAGSFSACERTSEPEASPHGTGVVEALLEIAPDVKLYIANPNSSSARVEVLRWLTRGTADNGLESADYQLNGNDDFNVDIINSSVNSEWDGPGNGISPFYEDDKRSYLNLVKDAVQRDVLWVNSAGNAAHLTWFKRVSDSDFTTGSDRVLKFDPFTNCNGVMIVDDEPYFHFLRWSGLWPGATTDLDLFLLQRVGTNMVPVSVEDHGNDVQAGMDGQYPIEKLKIAANEVTSGTYCLGVRLVSGPTPSWVQLQVFSGRTALQFPTYEGSLGNPAESNESGMLAVGATEGATVRSTYLIEDFSSRGPAPEPYEFGPPEVERIALDLVSVGTHPVRGNPPGTSFAAPRAAGEAALVIQALGDREEYDEPEEIVQYMKDFGSRRSGCVNDWGCGFAILGPLDPPPNLTLASTPNACRMGDFPPDNVKLTFDLVESRNVEIPVPYFVELRKIGVPDADSLVLAGGSLVDREYLVRVGLPLEDRHDVRLPGGETYVAEVHTCVPGVSGEPVCGMASPPSEEFSVPRELCRPVHFDLIPGDGMMTLRWDAQLDATAYDVERIEFVDDEWVLVPNGDVEVTDQHLVVSGVPRGATYNFRLRAKNASGTSAWSETLSNHTGNALPIILPLRSFQEAPSRNVLGQYDAVFSWLVGGGAALHEVRVREVGTETWSVLSSDPDVAGEGPRVIFTRAAYDSANFGNSNMYGAVTGLTPGTGYELQARGVNGGLGTPWTEAVEFTTLGRRPVESMTRPSEPADLRVGVSSVRPFPRVVLWWDALSEGYLHEIRVLGGGASTWKRLPFQPTGLATPYWVQYLSDSGAFIGGLIPGTEYHFAVRAADERNSSDALDYSPWSEVVTLTTSGVRSVDAPGNAAAPALKAPSTDLMAVVSGTTATLSWTAATNPAYVEQVVRRRDLSVSPPVWTEIDVAWDATSYVDTGLTSGKTYRYRVRSYKDRANDRFGEEKDGFADAVIP